MVASDTAHRISQARKAVAGGWIGSALEYYDFFIYATAASLVFPQIFFPSGDPAVAIVASLATYGVGYIARPVGAVVLGHCTMAAITVDSCAAWVMMTMATFSPGARPRWIMLSIETW